MKHTKISFYLNPLYLHPEQILVTRKLASHVPYARKYKQIRASILEVGIIEPLSISEIKGNKNLYSLLDGHMRFEILKELGHTTIPCLVSTDDENYTHNKQTNRLATIQEHFMIRQAIERGVSEERLAKALNLDIRYIKSKMNLLNGICPEVIELLKNREISHQVFSLLRKMKPLRQIECTELMLSLNNITVIYTKALLAATDITMLTSPPKEKKNKPSAEAIKKIENDISNLHLQYKVIEQNYAQDTLNLVVAIGYLSKLLANTNIKNHLIKYQPEILTGFEILINSNSVK
ncbi:plasmid partitioning protein RepB C-terminal domain-containing protein [Acinetobacter baumannii]|uniref:plasmid partitioning protein RepB C-terminal domain-containing protein n=1 Tax=Acinetobacter baumannii TaxID=470 RepID=UPI0029345175|nr:plasmid partitioning protein RepB C-terminal domain-containing protein [Acinetobacter baumannii]WOE33932.1 plasmid partitioning protein RepB C-terminal domain-containing protein [Acinetobacter baumannii]